MSTRDPDISHSLQKLSPLLQDAATEIRPAAMALKTCKAMTPFQPSGPGMGAMLRGFSDTSSKVRWKCQNLQMENWLHLGGEEQ
jgi:hypothetical protein